jgi:hypothetical protein
MYYSRSQTLILFDIQLNGHVPRLDVCPYVIQKLRQ